MSAFTKIIQYIPDTTPHEWWYYFLKRRQRDIPDSIQDVTPCVFVLSTGRVGTQTLSELLKLETRSFVYHEPYPRLFGLSQMAYLYGDSNSAHKILGEAFLATRERMLDISRVYNRGFIETGHHTTFLAPIILELLPHARFIHLVRHPYAVIRSAMRRGWYVNNNHDKTRIYPRPQNALFTDWEHLSPIDKNAWLWNETNQWISTFTKTLPSHQTLLIHAESLFEGEITTLEKLYQFAEAPFPPRRKVQHVLGRKLNSQKTGTFPPPDAWEEKQQEKVWHWVGKIATQLGYQK